MSKMDVAEAFFHACEGLEGREGCQPFMADGATFSAQSEPIANIDKLADYCDWMAGLGSGALKGCSYEIHNAAFDEENGVALFFATFHGKHDGPGGPVEPTGRETKSHYVYAVSVNDDNKVSHVTKIWNAPWALGELGWT